jgi:hypothetical protein
MSFVSPDGLVTHDPPFKTLGPRVAGLSDLGQAACVAPTVFRVGAAGDEIITLVAECHREAPLLLVHYTWPGPNRRELRLPSPQQAGFEPEDFAVGSEGNTVIAGRGLGRLVLARPTSAGTFDVIRSKVKAVIVTHLAIGATGAAWTTTLGQDDSGHDVWKLECEGEPVELHAPDGLPLTATQISTDADTGLVVYATNDDARWLFLEKTGDGGQLSIPTKSRK